MKRAVVSLVVVRKAVRKAVVSLVAEETVAVRQAVVKGGTAVRTGGVRRAVVVRGVTVGVKSVLGEMVRPVDGCCCCAAASSSCVAGVVERSGITVPGRREAVFVAAVVVVETVAAV